MPDEQHLTRSPAVTGDEDAMQEQSYIVYDQRALSMNTDDALVLVSCSSLKEARSYARDFPGCPVFRYDIIERGPADREGINETYIETLPD